MSTDESASPPPTGATSETSDRPDGLDSVPTAPASQPAPPPTVAAPIFEPDVQAAMTRVCRNCSTQATTREPNCPSCGKSYIKQPWFTNARAITVAVVVGCLLLGVAGFAAWRSYQANKELAAQETARLEQEAARQAELDRQAEIAAEKRQQAAQAAALVIAERKSGVAFIEKSVLKSAQRDSNNGEIEGYPYKVRCNVAPGSSMDKVNKSTTKFVCFAFTDKTLGHYYNVTQDWNTGRFTWKYDNR